MSPITSLPQASTLRFPRVSGDEPALADIDALRSEFSPRERG